MEEKDCMETVIWLITMIPTSMVFTGIGIFAWKRKKPMWFWSGSTVDESEIADIPAYNRANGIMWICYSAVFGSAQCWAFFKWIWQESFLQLDVLPESLFLSSFMEGYTENTGTNSCMQILSYQGKNILENGTGL